MNVLRWICSFGIATVVSTVALTLKVRVFVEQLRERRTALDALGAQQSEQESKLAAHRKKFVKTTRSITMIYASMMIGLAECLPLGVLQGTI